jgi:hypothetical protein
MKAPVIIYGSENWVTDSVDRGTTKTVEMKLLIYVSGHNIKDQMRNTNIQL